MGSGTPAYGVHSQRYPLKMLPASISGPGGAPPASQETQNGSAAAAAAAVNLLRLDAWWTGKPLDRTRTTHLQRLDFSRAAWAE